MNEKIGPLAFDSFPLLVLFLKQNGWERVRDLLKEATVAGYSHAISLVNVGEVFYSLLREHGDTVAADALQRILSFPIEIVVPTLDQTILASRFKAGGGLSYADCYVAALSTERAIPILTGDQEFIVVERQGVTIEWLPSNR